MRFRRTHPTWGRGLALWALVAISGAGLAQTTGELGRGRMSGDASGRVSSSALVTPFLYVQGNIGVVWEVGGWGAGVDARTENIQIRHNMPLTIEFSGFSDLVKTVGTNTGATHIPLFLRMRALNKQHALMADSGLLAASAFNGPFANGKIFLAEETGGELNLEFRREIIVEPSHGPGHYLNHGVIKISRF